MNPSGRNSLPSNHSTTLGSSTFEIDFSTVRTLVVEDDVRALALVTDVARGYGHHITSHSSAESAMGEWDPNSDSCPFDLIIVALSLPGQINGFDFIRWLRSQNRNSGAYLLVITGNRAIADVRELLKAGADDYLSKPFDAQSLDVRLTVAEHKITSSRTRLLTERDVRRNGERYREIFDQCPEALLIVSRDNGRIMDASSALLPLLGIRPQDAHGRFISLLFPALFENDDPRISEGVFERPVTLTDVRHFAIDGSIRFLDVTVAGFRCEGNSDIFLSIRDATMRRELESHRIHVSKIESVAQLASHAADGLGHHLTAIGKNLSLLATRQDVQGDFNELVGNAEESCREAQDFTSKLKDLGGAPTDHLRAIMLRPVIEKAAQISLESSQSPPEFSFADELWDAVIDENQLDRIITILTVNADEAMPGGGTVSIAAANVTLSPGALFPLDPGNYVNVRISDTGTGIKPENIHRVFDPCFTTKPKRTGMGLATVASIIKGSGGHIGVESTPAGGTTFSLYLPASTSSSTAGVVTRPVTAPFREPRVLFMDDDPAIRRVVEKMLTRAGFDTYCASDGAEAIEVYRQAIEFDTAFDVLLLDLDVPGGIGGVEAIRRIREEFPAVRALVTSGYVDDVVLENHQEFGFSGVITKPFSSQKLVSALLGLTGTRFKNS